MAERLPRPRGAQVSGERRQRPLPPEQKRSQEKELDHPDFDKHRPSALAEQHDKKTLKKEEVGATPVPDTPVNDIRRPSPTSQNPTPETLGAGKGGVSQVTSPPTNNPRA